jgi:hypothetical protein
MNRKERLEKKCFSVLETAPHWCSIHVRELPRDREDAPCKVQKATHLSAGDGCRGRACFFFFFEIVDDEREREREKKNSEQTPHFDGAFRSCSSSAEAEKCKQTRRSLDERRFCHRKHTRNVATKKLFFVGLVSLSLDCIERAKLSCPLSRVRFLVLTWPPGDARGTHGAHRDLGHLVGKRKY